jgi:hypothetical protein
MKTPKNYTDEYRAFSPVIRRKILASFQYWCGWTKTTSYRKMAGESLTRIEEMVVDGVFRKMRMQGAEQLEIAFEWDVEKEAPIIK